MKQHTSGFKNNIKLQGREIDVKINTDTELLTKETTNYLKPSFNVELFKTIMKEVEFEANLEISTSSWFSPEFGVLVDREYEYLRYGNYYINNNPEYNVDTKSYVHKGYDSMIESMVLYDDNPLDITYPIKYHDLISAIAIKLGWTFTQTGYPNENTMIEYDLYSESGYTYRDILDDLCPATMGNFMVTDEKELLIKYPEETGDVIDGEFLKEDNIIIGKKIGPINALVLSRAEDGDTINRKDEESIIQNDLQEIKIKDNLLLSSSFRENFIDEMFEKIKGFEYQVIDVASTGIGYYEPLDIFTINHEGQSYRTIALNSELNIEDGVEENLFSPELEESVTDYSTSAQTDKGKKNATIIAYKNRAKIEQMVFDINDQSEKIASITLTTDEINQRVSNTENKVIEINLEVEEVNQVIESLQKQMDGVITSWFENGVPTSSNFPASEWTTEELKTQHEGDIYYDKETGYAYRWIYDVERIYYEGEMVYYDGEPVTLPNSEQYGWILISDAAVTEALAIANEALSTAQNKIATYWQDEEPKDASNGDIWFTSDGRQQVLVNGSWVTLDDSRFADIFLTHQELQQEVLNNEKTIENLEKELAEFKVTTETQFVQTNEDFNFIFINEYLPIINNIEQATNEEKARVAEFIRFVSGNIHLGASDSSFSLQISKEEMAFYDGGSKLAYFKNNSLYVPGKIQADEVGVKDWRLIEETNGSFSIKKVG